MIVLPDGKVCRNLPEQVAENLKKIQEIIHFLDGVNIQDNLVVIADLSQILTEAELEIVERPVAFIYYNAELYIKKNEAAGVAYFVNVFSIEDTGTQLNFNSNEMQVNLGTGALTYATATATSYTKSQIDSLLALKANDNEVAKLTGANFTGPITSPSIIEDMDYVSDYKFYSSSPTGFTFDYVGCVKNGNKLTIVIAGQIQSATVLGNANLGYFRIPSAVGAKIVNSTLGVDPVAYEKYIQVFSSVAGTPKNCPCRIKKQTDNQIDVIMYGLSALDINTQYIFRIEATFLLSTNLAA